MRTNFGTKVVFRYLFCQLKNSNCIYIRMNFSTKLVFFRYLFCQLKIQIITEYTQPQHVGTAANYKVLHNQYISSTALK